MASNEPVHKVKLKDGRVVDFPKVGNGLPLLLKDGVTTKSWVILEFAFSRPIVLP